MENLTSAPLSKPKKILVAFLISYLFIYMFPFPGDIIPGVGLITSYYTDFLNMLNVFVGKHFLGLKSFSVPEMSGSGDGLFEYVRILTNTIIALVIGTIFFLFVKKEQSFLRIYDWIITYARYYVGLYMLVYGFAKLFGGQFREPSVFQLEHTYGNSSPMNLLWTFMGYSKTYTFFSGIGEAIAGLLLLFRRTTAIGCIMTVFIMVNVLMLNLCYDVPVKIFSAHLVFITMVILLPDLKRLFDLFVLRKTVGLTVTKFELSKRWMRVTRIVMKSILMLALSAGIVLSAFFEEPSESGDNKLSGVYKTETFTFENDSTAALKTKKDKWAKLIVGNDYAAVTSMVDSVEYYQLEKDSLKNSFALISDDGSVRYTFEYKELPEKRFMLSGVFKNDSISVEFKKKDRNDYLLVNRGFHWVNEYPFNR